VTKQEERPAIMAPIEPDHATAAIGLFGMVRNADTGEISWGKIAAGVVAAGVVAVTGWAVTLSGDIRAIDARMTLVLQRLDKMEAGANRRYTAEDADRDRMAARREADLLADRIDRLEKLRK
jgi:hypothetical protein